VGEWHLVAIGLRGDYLSQIPDLYFYTQATDIQNIGKHRGKFSHKGSYGHALLIGGSYGKIGAMVLSSKACLRAGVGLLTVQVPKCGYDILQATVPEAMVQTDEHDFINTQAFDLTTYSAVGVGPGLGKDPQTLTMLMGILANVQQPIVLDADALNLMAASSEVMRLLPPNSILTPHPKEFQRLIGKNWRDDFEKMALLRAFAQSHQVIVCLKGAHTAVALPDGTIHFNSTGNPGMATGGSGDVLTGIITGLLAQGFSAKDAAIFGVFQHGVAGDIAAQQHTQSALIASDIINKMGW
jgi:NAD(P)H-hydrate epimerase